MWHKTRYVIAAIFAAYIIGNFLGPRFITLSSGIALRSEIVKGAALALSILRHSSALFLALYAVFVAFVLFIEGENPDRTLLWMLILFFVPFLGLFIYLLVGPSFENFRRRRQFRLKKTGPELPENGSVSELQIENLLRAMTGAELLKKNRVRPLVSGKETFDAIKRDISEAEAFIHLQAFIIRDDGIGNEIKQLLTDAAKRGVKVRVLYDAIGSRGITKNYVDSLNKAGVKCFSFMPMAFPMFRRQMNYRNHRKILIIDGKTAYTGGYNISDSYLGKGPLGYWRDTHVRLEGEAVEKLHDIFLSDWQDRTQETPAQVRAADGCRYPENFDELPRLALQVVPSGVSEPWHAIETGFISMISRAKERVWITSPYVVPGPKIMSALIMAALSGVDVRILMPEVQDHFIVGWGSRSNIEELLLSGIKVYFYRRGFIHAKSVVADGDICSVGTCNLDVRSLEINFEDQLFIYDKVMAELFARQFEKDLEDSRRLSLEKWLRRPFKNKLLESFGKLYSAQI